MIRIRVASAMPSVSLRHYRL